MSDKITKYNTLCAEKRLSMSVVISDSIKYIGVDDTTIDLFESQYVVPEGVSYNSYVILDEKVAVMDTVDPRGMEEWEKNLLSALDGRTVDYLVVQHLEPDHAGSIARLVELFPDVTLVGNAKTFAMLPQFFDIPLDGHSLTVKEGDTLSLGEHTLTFVMAPMVHWPEVMVTYESKEKILSPQTASVSSVPSPRQRAKMTGLVRHADIISISSANMVLLSRHFSRRLPLWTLQ